MLYFTQNVLEDRPYFKLADGLYSDTIDDAIGLAIDILRGDRVARILLQFNASNSTVEDVQIKYLDKQIEARPVPDAHANQLRDNACFDQATLVDCLFLHPEIVDFSTTIAPDETGYKRLVLFLAITLLHESTHYKRHMYNRETEPFGSLVSGLPPLPESVDRILEEEALDGIIWIHLAN